MHVGLRMKNVINSKSDFEKLFLNFRGVYKVRRLRFSHNSYRFENALFSCALCGK